VAKPMLSYPDLLFDSHALTEEELEVLLMNYERQIEDLTNRIEVTYNEMERAPRFHDAVYEALIDRLGKKLEWFKTLEGVEK